MDAVANFTVTTVAIPPSPATSGTSLTVHSGDGANFPATPFSATAWPVGQIPSVSNAEIVRVTSMAGDIITTMTRAQEGTTAKPIAAGYQLAQTITAALWAQLQPAILNYAGAATDVVMSRQLSADAFARFVALANGEQQLLQTPLAPPNFGVNSPGSIGAGSDFQVGMESIADTAHMLYMTFGRQHLTDGTNYLYSTASVPFPLSGSPTLHVAVLSGSMSALASSGTLTVQGIGIGTGTISYTGKTGTGSSGTLTGCTSSGLTTSADLTPRHAIWVTDGFGAPIMWLSNYGGLYLNDQYYFAYGGVFPDNSYDIITGFIDDVNRNTGSAIFLGADKNSWIKRGNDGFGNSQIVFGTGGSAGNRTFTLTAAGWFPSSPVALGSIYYPWGDVYATTLHNTRIYQRVVVVTQSATPAINTDTTDVASITALAQAITSMSSSLTGTPVDGDQLEIRLTGTGARAITWGSKFVASTVALPTTTATTAMLIMKFEWITALSAWRIWSVS
jgi:hypothetical protein